jgi:glycosyltransferase involved in cell wall biosynthesis
MSSVPLISIITSTYNAAEALPHTMRSIAEQTSGDYEWIIVDGGSSDGTVELLKNYGALVSRWISEKDRGIYDAWNKACRLARGQWLIFLGAGDELASPSVLADVSDVLRSAYPAHEVVYGQLELVSEGERKPIERIARPWDDIRDKWQFFKPYLPMHPETFQHRTLFEGSEPFDLRFRFCADGHFLLRAFKKKPPLYIPVLIDRMPVGGVSTQPRNLLRIAKENWTIGAELGLKRPLLHTVLESFKLLLKLMIGWLPPPLFRILMDGFRIALGRKRRWSVR